MSDPGNDGSLALAGPATTDRAGELPLQFDPGPTQDPALRRRAERFVRALVEVIETDRPVTQLVRWTTPRVYEELDRRLKFVYRSHRVNPTGRARPRVVSVRVYQPCGEAAEVSAHVSHGERSSALALRFEVTEAGWRCTAISWC